MMSFATVHEGSHIDHALGVPAGMGQWVVRRRTEMAGSIATVARYRDGDGSVAVEAVGAPGGVFGVDELRDDNDDEEPSEKLEHCCTSVVELRRDKREEAVG